MTRSFVCGIVAVCLGIAILVPPRHSFAEPILKPRKYHGPIPKKFFTLSIGVMGGADNEEMWGYLDRQVDQPLQRYTDTKDFGAGLALDMSYTAKVHPQFALRAKGGLNVLQSSSTGQTIPNVEPDSTGNRPLLSFEREFDVWLFSLEASGMYFFQDASVKEFQTYIGAGFSFFFPYQIYRETLVDIDTGEPYADRKVTEFELAPGVHALLGFLYHIKPTLAFNAEGRIQMAQSKFTLNYDTENGPQDLSFDVDYTGFILTLGVSKFF
jgi:hypothetical protein